jgi:hypothetical protein
LLTHIVKYFPQGLSSIRQPKCPEGGNAWATDSEKSSGRSALSVD